MENQDLIKVDMGNLPRKFNLTAKQSSFALAYAMNETLKHAQRVQMGYMNRTYTIRSRSLLKASVRMFRFARASNLHAEMGINRNLMHIWEPHQRGGPERPHRSKYIAVPQFGKRLSSGKISKIYRPQTMKNSFVVENRGRKYIFRRVGKGSRARVEFMYALKRQIQNRPTLHFSKNVRHTINKRYDFFANKAIKRELKRAGLL